MKTKQSKACWKSFIMGPNISGRICLWLVHLAMAGEEGKTQKPLAMYKIKYLPLEREINEAARAPREKPSSRWRKIAHCTHTLRKHTQKERVLLKTQLENRRSFCLYIYKFPPVVKSPVKTVSSQQQLNLVLGR